MHLKINENFHNFLEILGLAVMTVSNNVREKFGP